MNALINGLEFVRKTSHGALRRATCSANVHIITGGREHG